MYYLQKEKNANVFCYVVLALGIVFSLLHLKDVLFDMVLSIMFYKKANICSVMYILHSLLIIYLPLALVLPQGRIPKVFIVKWTFYAISICYLIGNAWVIFLAVSESPAAVFSGDLAALEKYQRDNALMMNYMLWDCYSPVNVIFNLVEAFLFFAAGRATTTDRVVLAFTLVTGFLFGIIAPVVYNITVCGRVVETFWLTKNGFLFGSWFAVAAAFTALAAARKVFENFLWRVADSR